VRGGTVTRVNELGLGVTFSAADGASGIIQRVGHGLLETVGAASEAGKAIKGYFKEFSIGMAMFGAGAFALSALAPATREAAEFGKAIALVATESDTAVFSQHQMMEAAHELGNIFGKMPTDEAKAMYEAVGMGANTAAKATALMAGSNRLAVAGNADLKTTIDALGGSMRAYGAAFTGSNVNAYADTMFVGMTSGKTTVQELAGSLGRVTSMASSLGLSFDETVAAIAAMTSTGIEANQAVTGLHGAFANLLHPEAHATAEAARLGIKFDSVTLKTKGLAGMLNSIMDAKGFKGVETMKKLFPSVEGFNAIMQITAGNMGGFKDALGAMAGKAGAAQKGFLTMAETVSFQEDRLKSLKSTALIVIGQALEPMAIGMLSFSNAVLDGFNKLSPPVRDFLIRAFAMSATLLTVVGGAIAAKAAIGMLSVGMSVLGVTFGSVLATVLPVVAAIGLVAVAFYAFRQAYDENIGGFATFFDGIYSKVRLTFLALGQLFSEGAFSGAVLDELDRSDGSVENFAIRIWGAVERIKAFFGGVADGFEKAVEQMKPTLQAFATSLEAFGLTFDSLYKQIDPTDASASFDSFKNTGGNVGVMLGKVAEALVKVATFIVDVVTAVKPLIGGFLDLVGAVASSDVALGALKLALVAYASYMVAQAVTATASLGVAAAESAIQLGFMAASMNLGSVAGVVAGIRSIAAAATTANLAILPLSAAIGALYLAYEQWTKLKSEWNSKAASDMWAKFKNDVGIDDDKTYGHYLGQHSKSDDEDGGSGRRAPTYLGFGPTIAALPIASYGPGGPVSSQVEPNYSPMPTQGASAASLYATTEAAQSGGASSDAIGASVASAFASNPPVIMSTMTATMNVDGQVLGEISIKAQRGEAVSSETPVSLSQ
jgi:TP901 family phage tail tape measure protein